MRGRFRSVAKMQHPAVLGQTARSHAKGVPHVSSRQGNCSPTPVFPTLIPDGAAEAADRSWVLIDAGLATSAGHIRRAAIERFGLDSRPAAIILTHGHFDHVGALPELTDRWDVPIYAHRLEMPNLTGRSSYPPPDPAVGGGAMSFLSRFYPRGQSISDPKFANSPRMAPCRECLAGAGFTRLITAGHISLFRDSDRTLIVGDAFVTVKQESALSVLLQQGQVSRPPACYTSDWEAARRSVQTLAALQPELAATGHGPALTGDTLRDGLDVCCANGIMWPFHPMDATSAVPRRRMARESFVSHRLWPIDS